MAHGHGPDFCKKKAPRARFFCEKTSPQAKLIKENAPQSNFFELNPNGYCVLLM